MLERQRGRRDDDRHRHQQRERVGEAAGQIEQAGKLQRVEHQDAERGERAAAGARPESGSARNDVEPGRAAISTKQRLTGSGKFEAVGDDRRTAALWPMIASQRSRISVFSRAGGWPAWSDVRTIPAWAEYMRLARPPPPSAI